MVRTEQESDRRRREVADLLVLPRSAKSLQNGTGFGGKNLSLWSLLRRKKWHQYLRESSWQVRLNRLCQKEKEQSRLSRVLDRKGESQGEREPHLGEREGH